MGLSIDRDRFDDEDFERYAAKLSGSLAALRELLARPAFGVGPPSLGAELELSIIDDDGLALGVNRKVLAGQLDGNAQLELDRFNLEYNLNPVMSAGAPFRALEQELVAAIDTLNAAAAPLGGRLAPIGILPTLTPSDLKSAALTDLPRYRALASGLLRLRRDKPFRIDIDGDEPLRTTCNSVTMEGANTSFQVHLRVDPADYAAVYNAAQLTTPLVLAIAANSPTFLGHVLWDETRVALFKQAVDPRSPRTTDWRRAARVPFGHGWIRSGAYELFAEAVALHPALLPVCDGEDPVRIVRDGGLPGLAELRLHQSTVWQWNRAVYDPSAGGHLRIELRALPGGPTPIDMVANAALHIGLAVGLKHRVADLLPRLPFRYAEYNFYRAAQRGLDARLLWPADRPPSPAEVHVRHLLDRHLPVAESGLASLGIDSDEIRRVLGVIERRLETGLTGARWQRRALRVLDQRSARPRALAAMLANYLEQAGTGEPVSDWSLPD